MVQTMVRNEKDEAWFDQHLVPYRFEKEMSFEAIDLEVSKSVQSRVERIRDELVERYRIQMLGGARFPAIIVEAHRDGQYVILDGLHRFLAAERIEADTISVYVVTIYDQLTRDLLIRSFNSRLGERHEASERLLHAIAIIERHPEAKFDKVASEFGLNETTIRDHVRTRAVRKLAADRGLDTQPLGIGVIRTVLPYHENVQMAALKMYLDHEVSTKEAEAVGRTLRPLTSDESQLARLRRWSDSNAFAARAQSKSSSGRKRAARPPYARINGYLQTIANILSQYPDAKSLQLDTQDARVQFCAQVRQVAGTLAEVVAECTRAD